MATIINSKLGENRGKKRIWIEGHKLLREGYDVGSKYDVQIEQNQVQLQSNPNGKYTISKRTRNGVTLPIIDLNLKELAEIFDGVEMLRIQLSKGKIVVTAHFSHDKKQRREERLKAKLRSKSKLDFASFFHGGGVLDRSIHKGLDDVSIDGRIAVCNEIEAKYLEQSLKVNQFMFDDDSVIIESPIELIDRTKQPFEVDWLNAGIPCTGASKSGRTKNKLKFAESHDSAGACFFSTLALIELLNPSVVVIENVPEYANTASMAVIRSVLGSLGYEVTETVLNGNDFGSLEKRKRLCVIAISSGLGDFSFDGIKPVKRKEQSISEILEPVSLESDRYREFDYLAKKEIKDKAANKGFSRQLLNGSEGHCGVIGKDYSKCRSTEPFLTHPDGLRSRLFTPIEHCRLKGIPEEMIVGLSDTIAHQVLGQSVIFPAFRAVSQHIGSHLMRSVGLKQEVALAA
ncbi:DNA cytosine methyltransferase [Vibrio mediterranei]|uniref:DNA cytosine methyltransferase n=1 Tax=Vibrio mediterranei TaxID=689 RepID=UPI0040677E7B